MFKTPCITPLDPTVKEFKFYAQGVGSVLEVQDEERLELISIKTDCSNKSLCCYKSEHQKNLVFV
ncbi:hypothetical protein C3K47_07965 [Solitalea longa]|uniref:Uncharacterized protein n=1 Tax=Solitalea longa TaxID=2079460 RepID=A0A2S5A3U9_9SPHI|nr:hypothetical protein C3K47_07965 [Solitalea longa]